MQVRLSGRLICESQAQVDLVVKYLPEHVRLTRSEPGCLSFEVRQTENPMVWSVEELFANSTAFDAHQARTKASAWGTVTSAIRREYQVTTKN